MAPQDAINAALELCGALMVNANTRRLWRDRKSRGLHPAALVYYIISSWWFIYYYAHLEQWLSFIFALLYAVSIATWVSLVILFFIGEVIYGREL